MLTCDMYEVYKQYRHYTISDTMDSSRNVKTLIPNPGASTRSHRWDNPGSLEGPCTKSVWRALRP